MNTKLLLLTLLAQPLLLADLDLAAQGQRRDRGGPPPTLEHLEFSTERFESDALGGRGDYGIFLPKNYDAEDQQDKAYPLVIWLHGMFEDHQRFARRGGGPILDKMVGKGELPEMIFVCANGGRSSFYIDSETAKFETMVIQDLIAHVETDYRVSANRQLRAIAGVSMGGFGALKIALKHPQSFGTVAAHSAAIMPREPEDLEKTFSWLQGRARGLVTSIFGNPIDQKLWDSENVLLLADKLEEEDLEGLRIYFDCGTEDRYGFDSPNQELHSLLDSRKVEHDWRLVEGGNHGWRSGYNQAALPHSLRFLAESFAKAQKGGG